MIDKTEDSARTLFEAGLRHGKHGELESARTHFEQALLLDPCLEDAYASLAAACLQLRDFETAEACAQQGLTRFPNNLACREVRADARICRLDLSGAEADADEVLKSNPESIYALIVKANVLLARKRGREAIALLEKADELEPQNCGVLLSLGNAYAIEKNYTQAQANLLAAGKCDPLNWTIHLSLSNLELFRGDPATGLSYTDVVLALGGEAPTVYALRGQFFSLLKRWEEAEEAFSQAIAGFPNDALSLICLAELESQTPTKHSQARDHALRALEISPRDDMKRQAQEVLRRLQSV